MTAPNSAARTSRAIVWQSSERRQALRLDRAAETAATVGDSWTRPLRVELVRRAGRIDRHARQHAAHGRRASQSRALDAALTGARRRSLQLVDLVERVELQRAGARRRSAASRCRPTRGSTRHIRRDDARSPPCASVVAASDCSHQGAPGTWLARVEPRRPPPCSRAATSSGRTRCPACTPTCRARSRSPFRAARSPGRAGRRRPDTARPGRSPEPVGDIEPRVERRRQVEQRVEQRVRVPVGRRRGGGGARCGPVSSA